MIGVPAPTVFNAATGQMVHGAAVSDPSGGAVTDSQARTATNSILAALRAAGILAGGTAMSVAAPQFDGTHTAALAAITAPTGGTPDPELRTAIGGILTALRNAGIIAGRTVPASLTAMTLRTDGGEAPAPAVTDPSGGANIDANCRTAINSALAAMRSASLIAN